MQLLQQAQTLRLRQQVPCKVVEGSATMGHCGCLDHACGSGGATGNDFEAKRAVLDKIVPLLQKQALSVR